jgi:hypothetical protein
MNDLEQAVVVLGGGGSSSSSGRVAAVAIVSVHCLFNDAVNSSDYRAK